MIVAIERTQNVVLSIATIIAFTLIKNIYPLNPDIGERTTFCVLSIATIITHYL